MKKIKIPLDPIFEFHVAKKIRLKYNLDESFFSLNGNVVFANFYQVRLFVKKLNEKRDITDHVSPGEINGAGLLDEIYHLSIKNYVKKNYPNAFSSAISDIELKLGEEAFDKLLLDFIKKFPPKKVYKNEESETEYLNGKTNGIDNREILLEELILLHISNKNPALNKLKELFDENHFDEKLVYKNAISNLKEFFKKEEFKIGITNSDLFEFLSMPFLKYSSSIWDQLEYIKNEWEILIDEALLMKIQSSKDLFIESIKFEPNFGGGGTSPTIVPKYKGQLIDAEHLVIGKSRFKYAEDSYDDYEEPEQFTPDVNWMPNLVLIAKNIYVWLDQLSKKYQREIKTLDQIPIEELQLLKDRNINGLWLIGVWERSSASKRIKHLMGNIDAVASAYSLYDYEIAHDLGGEYAYDIFNQRAKDSGIRLASDMVPNHTGIYSKWMIEHPDYFIQLDYSPFPNYQFTGENLSENPNFEIRIEDQYYKMKDAAVVFERKDLINGKTKYFYHGNDGTNMPWNDTAQLNLLKHEVREALIQKIFDVARKFSVIRFDAAMTLAKKHFARLWYPQPGKGGDIPSRADFALTRKQFDEFFPKEFWREVVDRINTEMPETLLLAEAFWLMEGYFVRTLGMHRVYNSAFMNMMINEENAKYRELITNTLEFEPEILKRYVNFMSNPDEETAIDQFGSGDKYFGVLVLMCTLPGLPMFAHGQIEGFTEKYGMEYKRAYYDEKPQKWLVERHEKEIFPILNKRFVFSEINNFWLYDFIDQSGKLNENIFIFSNEAFGEKGLVIFNNSFNSYSGYFLHSRQKLTGNSSNSNSLHNTNIAYTLGIQKSDFHFYIFRDITTNLEYFYNGNDFHAKGMFLNLSGYEYRVFLVFKEIFDPSGRAYKYYKENFGRGIYNIQSELKKIKLSSVHKAFENLFSKSILKKYHNILNSKKNINKDISFFEKEINQNLLVLFNTISEQENISVDREEFNKEFVAFITSSANFIRLAKQELFKDKTRISDGINNLLNNNNEERWLVILIYLTITKLRELFIGNEKLSKSYISDLMLTIPIKSILRENIKVKDNIPTKILLIDVLLQIEDFFDNLKIIPEEFLKLRSPEKLFYFIEKKNNEKLSRLLKKEVFNIYLQVNTYENKTYFRKESLEELLDCISIYTAFRYNKVLIKNYKLKDKQKLEILRFLKKTYSVNKYIKKLAKTSNYLFEDFLKKLDIKS